jgi:hypothetical protein
MSSSTSSVTNRPHWSIWSGTTPEPVYFWIDENRIAHISVSPDEEKKAPPPKRVKGKYVGERVIQ